MRKITLYDNQRIGRLIFLLIGIVAVIAVMLISNNLVKALAQQEKERMNIWAKATERLAQAEADADFEFLLSIIEQNNSIPVMVADENFNILEFRNFNLPDKHVGDGMGFESLSKANRTYLLRRLKSPGGDTPLHIMARRDPHFIQVEIYDHNYQYIYYEDSILLKRLSWYPYIQLGVMVALVMIIYVAVIYTKRAEQNRVWVGLSKETAHQLGTPISSLMAWNQYLEATGADQEVTREIDKDVKRLSVIADRFSKIGSVPELNLEYLNDVLVTSLDYMKTRISGKVSVTMNLDSDDHGVDLSRPLFEWVMENLAKNAVDAMDGKGSLSITSGADRNVAWIEVTDSGKGIARKNFKTVFNPGYTTKKRGWGLGLTLVKRIIEDYHGGRIFVKWSEVGKGTTFRIELPLSGRN
ncbi:MAG: HAMP domain-containing histidine kinase [Muribaculaceae bacterium]|nr:HAMP domain-containing histidine kinase [Muribaculaceae bacterium]